MTKSQFLIAKLLSNLGLKRTQKRLLDAADELYLLKEAQEVLGRNVWSKVKDLKAYRSTVIDIEHLLEEKAQLTQKAEDLKTEEQDLKEKQNNHLNTVTDSDAELQTQYRKQQSIIIQIKSDLGKIKTQAVTIRKQYNQAKSYLTELQSSDKIEPSRIQTQEEKITKLKQAFIELKDRKIQADERLAKVEASTNKLAESINGSNDTYQDSTVQQFKRLGVKNKEISTLYSRVGIIDNKIVSLYNEIGQRVSQEAFENSQCRKLIKEEYGLCKIMRALRTSINYNHILGGRAW